MESQVLWAFLALVQLAAAYPQHGVQLGRSMSCREDSEYRHGALCCLKCAAGQFVQTPCSQSGTRGACEECSDGTFTEHANGLKQCIKCTRCPPDQEAVRPCSATQNTVCRCRPGRYCHPEEACEICKRCSRCSSDEEVVKNCTSTSNTQCKKVHAGASPAADPALVAGVAVPVLLLCVGLTVLFIYWRRRRRPAGSASLKPDYVSVRPPPDADPSPRRSLVNRSFKARLQEEMTKLCESASSSASSSQHNLTAPAAAPPWEELHSRGEEPFPSLVPVNGVESLRECFGFFEELNVDFHKRFFRQLSLNDNVIRSREPLPYEDRIHELLGLWVEKEGKEASLDQLLRALLELDQRRTAQTIMQRAVHAGHYEYRGC